jgi:hypothetical protein
MVSIMSDPIASRIRKLVEIAQELREGASFPITRLTRIKVLCEDPQAAAQFSIYMARLTWDEMKDAECPINLEPGEWAEHKELVSEALTQMESYMESPTSEKTSALREFLAKLDQVQDEQGGPYGLVRIIRNRYVLLMENSLYCVLRPNMSAHYGYHLARDYAKRYNPKYWDDLTPESAPLIEDIANFWCEYHYGQTLEQWKEQKSKTEKHKAPKPRKKQIKTQQKPMVIKQIVSSSFDKAYPNTTQWVKDYGWIEIGQTDYSSSLIRALDEGGMIWESSQYYETMDEAMKALETALADWMKQYKE